MKPKPFYIANLIKIIQLGRLALMPPPDISVSEWSQNNRKVTREESSRPGPWSNELVPFAVEPMNAFTDDDIEFVTCTFPAQLVKTEIIKNVIAYHIVNKPAPMMYISPTEDTSRAFSKEKLGPMITGNDIINKKIISERNRRQESLLHKRFEGGFLTLVGTGSPNSLAMRSVKIVLIDDADRIPQSVGEEGDPVTLAVERTESYSTLGYKVGVFSTPTVKTISRVEREYLKSDQRQYYISCPDCGKEQTLIFDNLVWEKEKDMFGKVIRHLPETVKYACKHCGSLIDEREKFNMIKNGKWIAKYPHIKNRRGYHINRLYSLTSTWSQIVDKFLNVCEDSEQLRGFYNTVLALTWETEESIQIDETGLIERNEPYLTGGSEFIPKEILMITAGIDTQDDRLEIVIKGWGLKRESWIIGRKKFWGDTELDSIWDTELDEELQREFTRTDGVKLRIIAAFVDSGGHRTQQVYRFCRTRRQRNIFAIKGQAGFGKPMLLNKSRVDKKRTVLINLGVDTIKESIYAKLKLTKSKPVNESGPRLMHFSGAFCDVDYFRQLTGEKAVIKDKKQIWIPKKKSSPVEMLDCEVYATAAMEWIMPNFERIKEKLDKQAEELKDSTQPDPEEKQKTLFTQPAKQTPSRRRVPGKNFVTGWKR